MVSAVSPTAVGPTLMGTTVAGEHLSEDGKPGMKQKNHSPVGLCRMKNMKGLSTINQGGDDLAIRIAAMERRRCVSQSAADQQPTPRCWYLRKHLLCLISWHALMASTVTIYGTLGWAFHSYCLLYSVKAPSPQ